MRAKLQELATAILIGAATTGILLIADQPPEHPNQTTTTWHTDHLTAPGMGGAVR